MKKKYLNPGMTFVQVESTIMISQSINRISSNANLNYGGGASGSARVKENHSYNVWDDDWQANK